MIDFRRDGRGGHAPASPPLTADAVRAVLTDAGFEIVAACSFSVMARGPLGTVHALEYPRGWRFQNAPHHPTRVEILRTTQAARRWLDRLPTPTGAP